MAEIEKEPLSHIEGDDRRSIEILHLFNSCDDFELNPTDDGEIALLYRSPKTTRVVQVGVHEFLEAVDYYQENRATSSEVSVAMQTRDGKVDVYAPERGINEKREVVVSIENWKVPQILEFAYMLTRQDRGNTI